MSRGKKPQAADAGVLAAEEALRRAKAARNEAAAVASAAWNAVGVAEKALQEAKVRADDHLPHADSCIESWVEGRPLRRAVVIVRRTTKTITTRMPGHPDEQQWRQDAAGTWRQWPERGSARWLELPEDAQ